MKEENQIIIKALNMFGRVPEQYELLNEINRLNNIINELEKYIGQEWYCFDNESIEFEVSKNILEKLKELKESGNNE